ncbi:MAG: 30S ribosomal protein S18 [Patescibacteria group bacterium]
MARYAMKQCVFCSQNAKEVDYRDVEILRRFISSQAKIIDPRHTGVCAKHQRRVANAIKRARIMGLLPFIRR